MVQVRPDHLPALTGPRRLVLNVVINFVLFILIGGAFRMPIGDTFLLFPAIINTGMLLSLQDLPWRISWRENRLLQDEETPSSLRGYQTHAIEHLPGH
jgi:hypothetical protein